VNVVIVMGSKYLLKTCALHCSNLPPGRLVHCPAPLSADDQRGRRLYCCFNLVGGAKANGIDD
jgi:hypothetical protein